MDNLYIKISNAYIQAEWSGNESLNPDAIGVIGIYIYNLDGDEHPTLEGGEFDVYEEKALQDYIEDIFEFIELPKNTPFEIINKDEFEEIVYN